MLDADVMAPPVPPNGISERRVWSVEEDEKIVELVKQHGTSASCTPAHASVEAERELGGGQQAMDGESDKGWHHQPTSSVEV